MSNPLKKIFRNFGSNYLRPYCYWHIFINMKLRLTEQQLNRILSESEVEGEMLSTYRLLAQKIIQRTNSIYGSITQMSIAEVLSPEFNSTRIEKELEALGNANDAAKTRIDNYIESHSEEEYFRQERMFDDLSNVAHEINNSIYYKIDALEDLLRALDDVSGENLRNNFSDVKPLDT